MKKIIFIFLTILCLDSQSFASDYYVTSAGGGNGSSCGSANSLTWLNTSTNWANGAGTINPGDTIHLCGTFTGTANNSIITPQGSGSAGNPITFHWETGAVLTSPACSNLGCIAIGSFSYLVFDGNGTTPSITATANGSGLTYQSDSKGIRATSCSNCEFKNLNITNMYVFSGTTDTQGAGLGIYVAAGNMVSIHNNTINNAVTGIQASFSSSQSSLSIYSNTVNSCSWAIAVPASTASSLSNVYIYSNHVQSMANWDTGSDLYHHNGIILYNGGSGTINNVYIYNNLFDGDPGANTTAWIYLDMGINGAYVYNNVMLNTASRALFLLEQGEASGSTSNSYYFNNYGDCNNFAAYGALYSLNSGTNLNVENNAFQNCPQYIDVTGGQTAGTIDYNAYSGGTGSAGSFQWNGTGSTFASYKVANPTLDVHSITPASLGTNATGVIQAGSALISAGTNLTNQNILTLDTGYNGNTRPTVGAWDIGANPYQSAGGATGGVLPYNSLSPYGVIIKVNGGSLKVYP